MCSVKKRVSFVALRFDGKSLRQCARAFLTFPQPEISRQNTAVSYSNQIYLTRPSLNTRRKQNCPKRFQNMEFNMEDGTFTSKEDVPYAVALDAIVLWIQNLTPQTLVGIGMIAGSMITFLGAKFFSKNEEPVDYGVDHLNDNEKRIIIAYEQDMELRKKKKTAKEVRPRRGVFRQVIDKISHIFGY